MDKHEVIAELQRRLDPAARRQPEIDKIIEGRFTHLKHLAPIVCVDGFHMSVQASEFHYCTPRDSKGPWTAVEVGYPSKKVEAFMPHIDGADSDPTDTVYGYVPLDVVAEAVLAHGGFTAPTSEPA